MTDDAQRWKAKYLESLEQQEVQEQRWNERLDLLRRGLVRSSLAAEGSDKAVDQCMQELRDLIRGEQMDNGLSALIPRLEKAVLDSEQRRQLRIEQNIAGITGLTQQLLALDPPREVRKALKQFSKRIEERASQPRELPALLAELSSLQGKALSVLGSEPVERPGLLQRLFGSGRDEAPGDAPVEQPQAQPATEQDFELEDDEPPAPLAAAPAQAPVAEPAPTAPAASQPAASPSPVPVEQTVARTDPGQPQPAVAPLASRVAPSVASLDSLPLDARIITGDGGDPAFALPERPEPGYSAVAPHIADSLLGLLDELELPEHHQPQGEALRERLHGGLNWYELVPLLDDLAVLVLAVTDSGQREFAGYLKQLNERLAAFLGTLTEAHEGYSESVESARNFNQELREQVSGLQASVQEAVDLPSLKRALEQRLDGLLSTVGDHQRQREGREEEVAVRLKALSQRVAEMEQEAQGFRDHLEEQRQKALTDPLTGLANRAGWAERLDLEVARWRRYGGELLLAVLDIDHFKRINDGYGHLAGDKVLKIIAGELVKRLRKTDFLARFGGEEFVLLVPSTPLEGGQQLLETLRSAVESCPFHFRGEPVTITLSGGLTAFVPGESGETAFGRADQALYKAKREGRNRVLLG
ncbi:GGDEF domain-containing protein [Pseudomonas sp. PDM15]|uniref:GGDEF domain-containing protein n=1 Tax=Pseudomonas sp. PDM15 TaxID=2769303 RepID=UPI00178237AA|nr:GGDEF domain-containing protein [Pseudomonas sp. PDM15]MBD9426110.1 GGDEF domain-containing protein [Pseudomonas sp. PDM15]